MNKFLAFLENNLDFFRVFALAFLTCVGFWALSSLLNHKLMPAVEKRMDTTKHPAIIQLFQGFRRPISMYLKVAGVCIALLILCSWQPDRISTIHISIVHAATPILNKTLRVIAILMITWGLVSSSSVSALVLRGARHRLDLQISKSVSRFLAAVYNVVVVAISAAVLLSELGYDINGLVAGLGLGGLTIALAAKDSASNFFGGLVLVMEKPFEIGDWIVCDGAEGVVEDINLRSTKIRTAPGSLTIVPNANVSGNAITNWSGGMEKRKADIKLELAYDTPRQRLKEYCSAARIMLETDPEIITDSVLVRFSSLSESSLTVTVNFYTTLPGFADHLRIKERVNYAFLELADTYTIAFAYPTHSVYLHNAQQKEQRKNETEL